MGGRIVDRQRIGDRAQATGVPAERRPGVEVLIDFEAPEKTTGSVSTSNRESVASASRLADRLPGNAGSYVRLSGEIVPTPPSGGFARLELPVSAPPAGQGGVFFRARATPRARYRVQLGTKAVQDGDDFGVEFVVDETWREYRLPFDTFAQVGFGKRVRFRSGEILTISWMTGVGATGAFQLDVDDVGWFR